MARTRKSIQALNLYKYDVLIEDKGTRSDYFRITQFDGYFYGGRNAFLIAGTSILKPNSKILVEVLNVNNETIFSAPISNFIEGSSRLVQVEIYSDTPPGPAKIVILGAADKYLDGSPIPMEWQDKYNVRWIADVIISPRVNNKTPIRFINDPSISVEEKFYPVPVTASFSQSVIVPNGNYEFTPLYYNTVQSGYLITLKNPTTDTVFSSDYLNGELQAQVSISGSTEIISASLPITKIFNNTLAESRGRLITSSLGTIVTKMFVSGTGTNFSSSIDPLGTLIVSASTSFIKYNKLIEFTNITNNVSFAKLRVSNLNTISGEINKIKISYKGTTDPGDFIALSDSLTRVEELLSIDSGSKIVNLGQFNKINVPTYWYAATMSLQKNDAEAIPPSYYFSSSFANLALTQSSDDLLDSIITYPEIENSAYKNNASYFIGTTDANELSLLPNSEYTLQFNALFSTVSGSTRLRQSENSVEVYLIEPGARTGKLLETNPRGQLLGTLSPTSTTQLFENVQLNFKPKINVPDIFGLRFIVYGGFWNFSEVSVKVAEEAFFSPDEVTLLIPNIDFSQKLLTFKTEYLDINNNSTNVSTISLPVYFTGSQAISGTGTVTSVTAGSGLSGGTITSIGTISINTSSVHFLDGVKKELNTEGVISSSLQINTGSFSGSFRGNFIGTSSWAVSSSFATSASWAPGGGSPFPFTGSASISGSLLISGTVSNALTVLAASSPTITIQGNTSPTFNIQGTGGTGTITVGSDVRLGSVTNIDLSFLQNNGIAWYINTNKHFIPAVNASYDLGLTSARIRTLWVTNISSSNPIPSASYAITASYVLPTGLPAGTVSSSLQINTGSFSGSFTGTLIGTSSWAASSSVAISASWAPAAGLSGGTTNYVPLWTGTGTLSSSVMFQNAGNVGIGITTPAHRLDVSGSTRLGVGGDRPTVVNTSGLITTQGDVGGWAFGHHALGSSGTDRGGFGFRGSADSLTYYYIGADFTTPTMVVQSGSSGNVGIGIANASPVAKLHIQGGSANWNETTPGTANGTVHLDPGVSTDNFGNAITFGASDSSNGENAQAGIYVRSDGAYGTKMYFATSNDYGAGSKTRMMVDFNGNIGIGTTSPLGRLHVSGANDTRIGLIAGSTRAVRIGADTAAAYVEGVDQTGVGSYQPLYVGGSTTSLLTGGTERWRVDSSGNLIAVLDNSYDIGGSGVTRPRSVYVATSAIIGNDPGGSETFRVGGIARIAGDIYLATSAVATITTVTNQPLRLGTNNQVRVHISESGQIGIGTTAPGALLHVQGNVSASSYTSSLNNQVGFFGTASFAVSASWAGLSGGTTSYIPLWSSATAQTSSLLFQQGRTIGLATTGSTNIIENFTTNAHGLVIAGTTPTFALSHTAVAGRQFYIGLSAANNDVSLFNESNGALRFGNSFTARWVIDSSGHLMAGTDNTYDIGASQSTRPRNIFVAGNTTVANNMTISGSTYLRTAIEHVVSTGSAPPTTVNYDVLNGAIFFYSGSATTNWTLNFRGNASTTLNSIMPVSSSMTVTLLTRTTTAYSSSAYQIDGTSITPRWQNGVSGSGNANSLDAHTFTIIKTSSTPTYLLLGSITKYT